MKPETQKTKTRSHQKTGKLPALMSALTLIAVVGLLVIAFGQKNGALKISAQEILPASPTQTLNAPHESPKKPDAGKNETITIRIANWNIHDCALYNAKTKEREPLHTYVAQALHEARVDIVVFEEIQGDNKKGGDIALLSVALAKEGWSMPYVAISTSKSEDDIALFSRYKIIESGQVLEPDSSALWPRPGIYARISVGAQKLDVYGFHFKAMDDAKSQEARLAQAKALESLLIARYGSELAKMPIVLAGDFNTVNPADFQEKNSVLSFLSLKEDTASENDFLPVNYHFYPHEPTFVDKNYRSLLDHLLLSASLARMASTNTVMIMQPPYTDAGIPVSDHRMILADIRMPAQP